MPGRDISGWRWGALLAAVLCATAAHATRSIRLAIPSAPVVVTPPNGALLNDPRPPVAGTAEAGNTVTVILDGTPLGTTPANGTGNWLFTLPDALADGTYSVKARGTNGADETSPDSPTNTFTIDTLPPDTFFVERPPASTSSTSARFDFASDEPTATYECRLDGASFVPCSDPMTFTGLADGIHLLEARARDTANNVDPSPTSYAWTVDATAPLPPVVVTPANGSSVATARPPVTGTAEPLSTVSVFLDGTLAGTTTVDDSGNWLFTLLADLTGGSHAVKATAMDVSGNVSPESPTHTFTFPLTSEAPETTLVLKPSNPSNSVNARFTFSSDASPVTYECSLDGAPYVTCGRSTTFPCLRDGAHSVSVRARNATGSVDATPASYTWTVDTKTPETTLGTRPSDPSTSSTASFTFNSDEAPVTYECSLDGAAYASCDSPLTFTDLTNASHTLRVRAKDPEGKLDPTPASHTWTVDSGALDTFITTSPPNPSSSTSASFDFAANASPVTYECRLDGATYASCSGPTGYTELEDGPHTLTVRARNAAGQLDETPASYSWTIDTLLPDTFLVETPPARTPSMNARFSFGSNKPGVTYECRLDGASFVPCSNPMVFTTLSEGNHGLAVRARDAANNVDSSPVAYAWMRDPTVALPPVVLTPTEGSSVALTRPPVTGTAEVGDTITVILDGDVAGTATPDGAGRWNFTPSAALTEGPHTVKTMATNPSGGASLESAPRTFTVDLTPPDTTLVSGPPLSGAPPTATFDFASSEPGSRYECRLDGEATFSPCSDPVTFRELPEGSHMLEARARDAAGNVDATPATYTWRSEPGTEPPGPTLTTPANGSLILDKSPTYSGAASAGSAVFVKREDGSVACMATADATGAWSCVEPTLLTDQSHTLLAVSGSPVCPVGEPASTTFTVRTPVTSPPTDGGTGGDPDAGVPEDDPSGPQEDLSVYGRGCSGAGSSPLVWLMLLAAPLMRSRRPSP